MTTARHNTRLALTEISTEIPTRLEQLRVENQATPGNVLNTTLPDNSFDNILLTYLSPAPSPDEIVIRQRGRRRISKISWSPEKLPISSRYPLQKTPTKANNSMGFYELRSSPRKRLLLNEYHHHPSSPTDKYNGFGNASSPSKSVPILKKLKLEDKPVAQVNFGAPLNAMLKGLSHDQLVGIIKNLVKDDPQLEEKIRHEFPMPDIRPMENQLIHIKRIIFKSFPASRLIKKTDSSAYSRVSTHLTTFKKSIVSQSRILYDSKHWDALLDYASMAWNYVRATPIWDNNSHNAIRRHCFKILSWHCASALRFGGTLLGLRRLREFEKGLTDMTRDCEEIVPCISQVHSLLEMD